MAESEGVAFVQADVERFCAELVGVAPAIRLARLAELRVMLEDVVATASAEAMAEARDEGWGLRRIGRQIGMSHEQVRRTLAKPLPEPERA
jgi:alpha-glucuronidase